MPQVRTRAGELHYAEAGDGIPLILLHANPGDRRDWDAVVPPLAARCRVIAVDWPGYGESPAPEPPSSASASACAGALEDLIDALALAPAIVAGNSVGGYCAARLAIARPEAVRALVLVDSAGFTRPSALTRWFCRVQGREWVARAIAARFAAFYLKRRTPTVEAMLARARAGCRDPRWVAVEAALWRSFAEPELDLRARAAAITAPTLIVWGRRDPVVRLAADGEHARRAIAGARLVALDTGHAPFAEDPPAFLAAVEPLLAEAGVPPARNL